jgi:hypothetical protein
VLRRKENDKNTVPVKQKVIGKWNKVKRYFLVKIGAGSRGNPLWLPDCIINGQGQATAPTGRKSNKE